MSDFIEYNSSNKISSNREVAILVISAQQKLDRMQSYDSYIASYIKYELYKKIGVYKCPIKELLTDYVDKALTLEPQNEEAQKLKEKLMIILNEKEAKAKLIRDKNSKSWVLYILFSVVIVFPGIGVLIMGKYPLLGYLLLIPPTAFGILFVYVIIKGVFEVANKNRQQK